MLVLPTGRCCFSNTTDQLWIVHPARTPVLRTNHGRSHHANGNGSPPDRHPAERHLEGAAYATTFRWPVTTPSSSCATPSATSTRATQLEQQLGADGQHAGYPLTSRPPGLPAGTFYLNGSPTGSPRPASGLPRAPSQVHSSTYSRSLLPPIRRSDPVSVNVVRLAPVRCHRRACRALLAVKVHGVDVWRPTVDGRMIDSTGIRRSRLHSHARAHGDVARPGVLLPLNLTRQRPSFLATEEL